MGAVSFCRVLFRCVCAEARRLVRNWSTSMALLFNLTKVSDAITADKQVFQSHLTSGGICDSATLAADVSRVTKESASVIEGLFGCLAEKIKGHLMQGERVVLDGLCRFELYAEGAFPYEDSPWDKTRNRVIVRCIPFDAVKSAAAGIDVENELKPTVVQILGVQDEATLAQNILTLGHTALLQGKGLRQPKSVRLVSVDDPSVSYPMIVSHSTAGTINAVVPSEMTPTGPYSLEVESNDGKGDDYMPVKASRNVTIVAAE